MVTPFKSMLIVLSLGASAFLLTGCGRTFTTNYSESAPPVARSQWKIAKVNVEVPANLVVSEANEFIPQADIVWHGDVLGDRRAQVAEIVKTGISSGLKGLHGSEQVVVTATVTRFHALTPKAYFYAPPGTGVHSVGIELVVTDAKTGKLLAGPTKIEADIPAGVAADMVNPSVDLPGAEWKSVIESHIGATVRSWLGTGPDIRNHFVRLGA